MEGAAIWRFKILMTALAVAFAGDIAAGSGTVAGQSGGPLSNTDAGMAASYQPPYESIEVFTVVDNQEAVWDIWKANNGPWQPPI
ncbi:MAG: hypothetical protein AB7R89_14550 [Dehalococcoidia bacterium]